MDERAFDDLLELYRWRFGIEDPSLLDWTREMRVRPRITDAPVRDVRPNAPARNTVIFGPAGERLWHPDRSVQIVVLDHHPSAAMLAEARRVARDSVVVWARDSTVSVEWLRDPVTRSPEVSLLIHGDDGERLDACLRSIAETTPATGAIELIVADAGATDAAAHVVAAWSERLALRHVRAEPAHGPVAALNRAAEAARGELLVCVSDRTRALPGWLRPLVRTLRDEPGVGVAGGKLITEGGALQQAGGVLFADGSVAGFGSGSPDPQAPLLGFTRDADYVSAGLLATRSRLFRGIGGIDRLFHGGYADVDYCLRVRAAGRRVVYQPQSIVIAGEWPPAAAASDAGKRFVKRWATQLAALPPRPARFDAATWDRLARVA